MTALLPAELAWYATGRFYQAEDDALADYGYFLHLPFLDVPLFDGERGETHAHFTFAARPFKARTSRTARSRSGSIPSANSRSTSSANPPAPSTTRSRLPKANASPPSAAPASWSAPRSDCPSAPRSGVRRHETVPLMGTNVFSARLIASTPFEFGGGRHDLALHLGHGITQFGTASVNARSCRRRRATSWCCRSPGQPLPWVPLSKMHLEATHLHCHTA